MPLVVLRATTTVTVVAGQVELSAGAETAAGEGLFVDEEEEKKGLFD